jgi:FkbM family methyltransferase
MKKLIQIIGFIQKHPLASKHLLRAFYRFFSWQIIQSIFPHKRVVNLIGSTQFYMRKGLTGATGNYYTGLLEFSEMAFLLHSLREEDCFADVGANIGVYTLLASGYCGANTIAFEPVSTTYEWLEKNIILNRIENKVVAYNYGVGSSAGTLHFSTGYDTINHVVSEENVGHTKKVQVNTLEHFCDIHVIPLIIKVDVEGYETEVINGLGKLLHDNRLKVIIIELNGSGGRYGYDEAALHNRLLDAAFQPYSYNPFTRVLQQLDGKDLNNTIYIRDLPFIQERVNTAMPVKVFGEVF